MGIQASYEVLQPVTETTLRQLPEFQAPLLSPDLTAFSHPLGFASLWTPARKHGDWSAS